MPRVRTATIAITAMMMALTFIMFTTAWGTIPLPIISVTIAILPSIVTAMAIGLAPGIIVGTAAGLSSLYNALVNPVTLLSPFIQNPLVSVLPRMLVPVAAYFVFKGLYLFFTKVLHIGHFTAISFAAVFGAAAASLTNTAGVLGMLYIIYAYPITALIDTTAAVMIWGIVASNALPEVIVNGALGTMITVALFRAKLASPIKKKGAGASRGA